MRTVLTLVLVGWIAAAVTPAQSRQAADMYQEGLHQEEVKGDLQKAIAAYESVVSRFADDHAVAAKALLGLGRCYEKLGKRVEARRAYERIARDYPDQRVASMEASSRLAAIGDVQVAPQTGIVATQIWSSPFVQGGPSPDGRYIPWTDWGSGRSANLMVHDLVTGEDRQLTKAPPGGSSAENPVFTPDGRQLIFTWYDHQTDKWDVRSVNVDGTNQRTLFSRDAYSGHVSSDGKHMAMRLSANALSKLPSAMSRPGRSPC